MALPFTDEQIAAIRERLLCSAQKHALHTGLKKTSLDMLTDDAGIAKSTFYKFFDSKEMLFLEVASRWEQEILREATALLNRPDGGTDKERAAALVYGVFCRIHDMGMARFLREDIPLISAYISQSEARAHVISSADLLFDALQRAQIRFTAPDDIVRSVIQLMYLSILHISDIGDGFFPALQEVVAAACDRLVA